MAGFDFTVKVTPKTRALTIRMARKLKRTAGLYSLDVAAKESKQRTRIYIVIDGRMSAMQAARREFAIALSSFAEGATSPRGRKRRIRVAKRICVGYMDALDRARDDLHQLAQLVGGVPHSTHFDVTAPDLSPRLAAFSQMLDAYFAGQLPLLVAIEDAHTTLVWLLNALTDRPGGHFPTLVENAQTLGALSAIQATACQELSTKWRNPAKHRNRAPEDSAASKLNEVIGVVHHLVREVQSRPIAEWRTAAAPSESS
ncbi:MAG: hypothetical protein AB7J35_18430 [Dehalococcoidia bacterium]